MGPQVVFELIRQIRYLVVNLMWSLKLGLYFSLSKDNMGKTSYTQMRKAAYVLELTASPILNHF